MPERPPPDECANCGAAIPRNARSCPECGADERSGWRESDLYDGLDLPDDGSEGRAQSDRPRQINGLAWYWWVLGVVLLLGLLLLTLPLR